MAGDLRELEDWLKALLSRASPAQVRVINRRVGYELRRSQAARIAAQRNPDGTAYVPRKPARKNLRAKTGTIRRRSMFAKLRTQRFLKVAATAEEISVGFRGRAGWIATTHQTGGRRVGKTGRTIVTPKRELLGLTSAEMKMLVDAYLLHLAATLD